MLYEIHPERSRKNAFHCSLAALYSISRSIEGEGEHFGEGFRAQGEHYEAVEA